MVEQLRLDYLIEETSGRNWWIGSAFTKEGRLAAKFEGGLDEVIETLQEFRMDWENLHCGAYSVKDVHRWREQGCYDRCYSSVLTGPHDSWRFPQ